MRLLLALAVVVSAWVLAGCSSTVNGAPLSDDGGAAQDASSGGDDATTGDAAGGPSDGSKADGPRSDAGLCGAVPSGGCTGCLKTACCGTAVACLADTTCAACLNNPNGIGCATDQAFGRVQLCATDHCSAVCSSIAAPPMPTCPTGTACDPTNYQGLCSIMSGNSQTCCDACPTPTTPGCGAVVKTVCCGGAPADCGPNIAPCCAGFYCQNGLCAACRPVGTPCGSGDVCCDSATCSGGKCLAVKGGPCGKDADCVSGTVCIGNTCSPPRPAGSSCTTDAQCATGLCASGVCKVPCDPKSCSGCNDFGGEILCQYCSGTQCCSTITDDWGTSDPSCY